MPRRPTTRPRPTSSAPKPTPRPPASPDSRDLSNCQPMRTPHGGQDSCGHAHRSQRWPLARRCSVDGKTGKRMTSAPLALRGATFVVALTAGFLLSACAQLLISGASMGATAVYNDRRTPGMQVEDQTVEFKASSRVNDTIGDR